MGNKRRSALVKEEREFTLEGYGKEKKDAYGSAFAALKKLAYKEIDGLIIHMEPVDVFIEEEHEKTKTQKLAGYFKPRQIEDYYVKMQVIVMVKYIPS